MRIMAILDHPEGPIKIGPSLQGTTPANIDNFTKIPLADSHRFVHDIATMYRGEALTPRDKLVGVAYLEDRILYCARRLEVLEKLGAVRSAPFVVEIINSGDTAYLNYLPVASVKKIGNKVFYGLPYGDLRLDYVFPE